MNLPATPRPRGRPPSGTDFRFQAEILETATRLFFEQGFGRTTLDQVSAQSGAGKSTLYRRFPNKHALFEAVVLQSIASMFRDLQIDYVGTSSLERLRSVGLALIDSLLIPRCVAFMRITAAETAQFPEIAHAAYRESYEGSVRCVAHAFTGSADKTAAQSTLPAARLFVEITVQPLAFQALYDSDLPLLRQAAAAKIEDAIVLLQAKALISRSDS